MRQRGHVECAADESAADRAKAHAVEPDLGRIVDAVEGEAELPPGELRRHQEFTAVPVVLAVQRLRDGHVVQSVGRIRIDTIGDQCRQHGARHDGDVPVVRAIVGAGDACRCSIERRRRGQVPRADRPAVRAGGLQAGRQRQCRGAHRRGERRIAVRQCPGGLRLLQSTPGFFLPRPAHTDLMKIHQAEIRAHRVELRDGGGVQSAGMQQERGERAAEVAPAGQIREAFRRQAQHRRDRSGRRFAACHLVAVDVQPRHAPVVGGGDGVPRARKQLLRGMQCHVVAELQRELPMFQQQAAAAGGPHIPERGDDDRCIGCSVGEQPTAHRPCSAGCQYRRLGRQRIRQADPTGQKPGVVGTEVGTGVGWRVWLGLRLQQAGGQQRHRAASADAMPPTRHVPTHSRPTPISARLSSQQ